MAGRLIAAVLVSAIGILTPTAVAADPIQLISGSLNNTRVDASLTAAAENGLVINLLFPDHPSWFGILNPGERITLDFTTIVPFPAGTVQVGGVTYPAPITFEAAIRTPEFTLQIGASPPFALEGSLTDGFGRLDLTGGGSLSITEEALRFNFEPNPTPVPGPVPEPATWLLVMTGAAVAVRARRAAPQGRR